MLEAMRQLGLDHLCSELCDGTIIDPETWYREIRRTDAGRMFPWLVEPSEKIERYYTMSVAPDHDDLAILEVHDFKPGDALRLPFNQPTGSQSGQLGPVIKRTWYPAKKTSGPSPKILATTLKDFHLVSEEGAAWSPYFAEVVGCLQRKAVRCAWDETEHAASGDGNAFTLAVELIPERKNTVFLACQDREGRLPGDVAEYIAYLQAILADTKYTTRLAPAQPNLLCPLCGAADTVYPNAVSGAGINLANMDREGAFPGVDVSQAWKGYALCGACADLLYVYKNHVATDYYVTVAGGKSLVVPFTDIDPKRRGRFVRRVKDYVRSASSDSVPVREEMLMRLLGDDVAVTSLTFLWAEFGNSIDSVKGIIADVMPTRLRGIERINSEMRETTSLVFPQVALDDFHYDLRLSLLGSLLKRPGGKKAKSANASKRLFDLKRELAASIYHGREGLPRRFWEEVLLTAQYHLNDVAERRQFGYLLYEGFSEKKQEPYLTTAGWTRQLAKFLHYLRRTGVMPVSGNVYQTTSEALKPYFTPESAIDSKEKAFAFILGALYGKVMQVQAARGVNVGANALTWLKRLTLSGKDLPELYIKVREKLLAYETEGSAIVRELIAELGALGVQIGDQIDLDETQTCYYLLLGQSLATTIMPKKDDGKLKGEE